MRRAALVFTLALAVFGLLAVPAAANDSAIGGIGGAIRPISVPGVRMESETVQVIMFSTYAVVRADFKFVNSGDERTVQLGFPFDLPSDQQDLNDLPPAAGFRAWQDEVPLAVTWQPPERGDIMPEGGWVGYYVHEATFKPGTTMIRVTYLAQPSGSVPTGEEPDPPEKYAGMLSSPASYSYWVHTGAGWDGTIGKSVIRFSLSPEFQGWGVEQAQQRWASQPGLPEGLREMALDYEKPDPSTYQWTFTDYEPTLEQGANPGETWCSYDVSLHYFQPVWRDKDGEETDPSDSPPDRVLSADSSSFLVLDQFEYRPDAAFYGVSWPWAEGAEGPGVGEWVKATFAGERPVKEIRVLPGYAKSPALFVKYNRPKRLVAEFSDGTKRTMDVLDEPSLQVFPVDAKATWAKVTIEDVYRGTARDETYISLIDFGSGEGPRFETYEQVMSGKAARTGGSAAGGDGAEDEPAGAQSRIPAPWILIAVAGAGVAGLAVIGGLVALLMRSRKP